MPTLSLTQMVDLALGSPELGAVNFNVLHSLLHAVIGKLNIADCQADINDADKDLLSSKPIPEDGEAPSETDSAIGSTAPGTVTGIATPTTKDSKTRLSYPVPYHALEKKVSDLQDQLQALNDLPSNKELFERAKGDAEKPRPVSDMWQTMQLTKRVDGNEAGVNKLMSLVEDLMGEVDKIRAENEALKKQMADALEEARNNANKFDGLDDLLKRLKDLENITNELNSRMAAFPDPDSFSDYVTWAGLEDALKGIRESMNGLTSQPERVVIEMAMQTDPASRPASSRSRASTPGPSPALQEILERLGKLTDQHDLLEERVENVEEELKNKLDKGALDGLGGDTGVSQELLDQLKELQDQLEALKKGREKLDEDTVVTVKDPSITAIAPPPPTEPISSPVEPSAPIDRKLSDNTLELLRQASESITTIAKNSENITGLNTATDLLQSRLASLEELFQKKWESLEDQLEALRESILDNMRYSPVDIPASVASSEDSVETRDTTVVDSSAVDSLEQSLRRKASEINQKVKLVSQNTNRQLLEAKENLRLVQADISRMADTIDQLKDDQTRSPGDSDNLTRMQQAILQLQAEIERISNTTQTLVDDNGNHKKDIKALYGMCNKLEENKADKEYVQLEVEVKADKRLVDGKVNRTLFDSTCDDLNKMINDILSKLLGHEDEWKKALSQLTDDLDGKLDRLEFGPIRDELERQLKALLKRLKNLNFDSYFNEEDDAAGIRKQLIQKFNCISCDRPVEMAPQGPIPSIPATNGMPASKSTRPYTTFELDTIRQHAKRGRCTDKWCKSCTLTEKLSNFERAVLTRQNARCRSHDFRAYVVHYGLDTKPFKRDQAAPQTQVDVMDLYATQRPCGGSHTLTYPNKRTQRLTHVNALFREDQDGFPMYKEEKDIQGADGHVYRGRRENTLPIINQTGTKSPSMSRKAPHPPSQSLDTKQPSGRPSSANGAHPVSNLRATRPTSAQREIPTTEVPTGQGYPTAPPAPAPSEPDQETMAPPANTAQAQQQAA